jgi:hypothetical protein
VTQGVKQLLTDCATAMAAQDGAPVGVVHIHGAANWLQTEILKARDLLIHTPRVRVVEVPTPFAEADAPEPVVEAAPAPVVETAAVKGAKAQAAAPAPEPEAAPEPEPEVAIKPAADEAGAETEAE